MAQKQTLITRYPPDYDGELHIHTSTDEDAIGKVVTITVSVRALPNETLQETVHRVGYDMQRAR